MDELERYLDTLKQRKQVYIDYSRLDYEDGAGTNVLSPNDLYRELGDEIDTIVAELEGLVKRDRSDALLEAKDGN